MLDLKKVTCAAVLPLEPAGMAMWTARVGSVSGGAAGRFFRAIGAEDSRKHARLRALARSIGLPVYDTREFELPREVAQYTARCQEITTIGAWTLALRFSDQATGTLLTRQLGANLETALEAIGTHCRGRSVNATVVPYRTPERSGTLLINRDGAVLELVFGPHSWLAHGASAGAELFRCDLRDPFWQPRYSLEDAAIREVLWSDLTFTTSQTTGLRVRQLAEARASVYAEYHWHASIGYRFIECSFSGVWTGSSTIMEDSRRHSSSE